MTITLRFLLLILLFLSVHANHIDPALFRNIGDGEKIKPEKKNSIANEILKISNLKKINMIGALENHSSLINKLKRKDENEIFKSRFKEDQSCLIENGKKIFENLKEAEEYLRCLLKEKKVLVGDFYGENIMAYRYVNIFDRMGYIRYEIMQIDKKIKKTKLRIYDLRKKLDNLANFSPYK